MNIEDKLKLFYKRPTEEIVSKERLIELLEEGRTLNHYIGFEISGLAHLGTGLMTALKVKDLIEAGVKPTIFLADYHSWINRKLGGDLEVIQRVAAGYFKSVFISFGLDESKVDYVLASSMYNNDYWKRVIEIGNNVTLNRVKRAMTIMGREESESNPASFVFYPIMQASDIFMLDVDIAHAGMDQRKVHMLAIDVAEKLKLKKPVALHTHLLPSLKGNERMGPFAKMSKSIPDSAIFIHDSPEEIRRKIKNAYCPVSQTEGNPVFELMKWLIYREDDERVIINRPEKFGGNIEGTFSEIESLYKEGKVHPMDLKMHVAEKLIEMLSPVRDYFDRNPELIEEMKNLITR